MKGWSNWYDEGDEIGGTAAPPCPHCEQPVRRPDTRRDPVYGGVANPPWNAGWEGCCEHCGTVIEHESMTMGAYQVSEDGYAQVGIGGPPPPADPGGLVGEPDSRPAEERLLPHGPLRSVRTRPVNIPIRTFIDEGVVLAGVEICVVHKDYAEDDVRQQRIRLTLEELDQIREALLGPLAPVTEQWGWSVDNT